jgi:hypothetical protein
LTTPMYSAACSAESLPIWFTAPAPRSRRISHWARRRRRYCPSTRPVSRSAPPLQTVSVPAASAAPGLSLPDKHTGAVSTTTTAKLISTGASSHLVQKAQTRPQAAPPRKEPQPCTSNLVSRATSVSVFGLAYMTPED